MTTTTAAAQDDFGSAQDDAGQADDDPQAGDWIAAAPPAPVVQFPRRTPSTGQADRADRIPPHDLAAERAVLGSILIDAPVLAEVMDILEPGDFYRQAHRLAYGAMLALYERGEAPDVVTVAAELERHGDLQDAGGASYLSTLGNDTPTSIHVGQYAAIVAAKSQHRQLIQVAGRIAQLGWDQAADGPERAAEALAGIAAGVGPARARTAGAVALADFLADPAPVQWAIPNMIVEAGFVALLGAPESFKSWAALGLGLTCAGSGDDFLGLTPETLRPFLYVSNEKSPSTIRARLRLLSTGRAPSEPVMILHRQGVTFGRGWDVVRRCLAELGRPAFVALDTLASLSGPGFDENSGADMAVALSAIRGIVTDYGATVVLSHHPNKSGEGEGGARLRGHSSLHGEVDAVIGMRRYSRDDTTGMLTADVKDGERLMLSFRWDLATGRLLPAGEIPLSIEAIAGEIGRLGGSATGDQIAAAFPGHPERTLQRRVYEAIEAGKVERIGKRRSYRYCLPGMARSPGFDLSDSEDEE